MNSLALRFVVVPSVGGLVAAALAYELIATEIWWIGLVMGSLFAGFIWSFRDIVRFAPIAAHSAWSGLTYIPILITLPITLWKAWQEASIVLKWRWRTGMATLATWCLFAGAFIYVLSLPDWQTPLHPGWFIIFEFLLLPSLWIAVQSLIKSEGEEEQRIRELRRGAVIGSPVGSFVLAVQLGKFGLVYAFHHLPAVWGVLQEVSQFGWNFAKTLFFFIHSKELAVVMLFALIAGGIGVWAGSLRESLVVSMTFGALSGAIFGFVYHRFVYIRIAHRQSVC